MAVSAEALHVRKPGPMAGSHMGDLGRTVVNLDAGFPFRTELSDGIQPATIAK